MKHTIDPQRLRDIRKSKNIRQKTLTSNHRGLSLRAIQRYEKEPMEVDEAVLLALATRLRVEPGVLTGELPLTSLDLAGGMNEPNKRLSVQLSARTQLNFDLIGQRYGVGINDVISYAPALFVLFAEQSLKWRTKRRQEKFGQIELVRQLQVLLPDLAELTGPVDRELRRELSEEFEQIRSRKLFGKEASGFPGIWADYPFREFLAHQIREAGLTDEIWFEDSPDLEHELMMGRYSIWPPLTRVCNAELDQISGSDYEARLALIHGAVRVVDIPPEFLSPQKTSERIQWLRDRWVAYSEKRENLEEGYPDDDWEAV